MVLPMNTGAEAVETAMKTARRWGYDVKGVAPDRAKIIVADGNFHGRTITIVSFSTDPSATSGFGPFTPGFASVPYGDIDALRAAIDDDTVAFLVEPIQGEAGVIVPPDGYLPAARELCTERNVLLIADEIQSGLGRTGTTFACEHEGVVPDVYVLGKALGGGIMPLSAVVADRDVLGVFRPASTAGRSAGTRSRARSASRSSTCCAKAPSSAPRPSSARGWPTLRAPQPCRDRGGARPRPVGRDRPGARAQGPRVQACERLMERGILAKDTHERTIRLAPPLCVSREDLDWALERILDVLSTAGR